MTVQNAKPETQNTLAWATRLRNIATVLVIIIHVSSQVVQAFPFSDGGHWWTGNGWNAFGRPAVNLFVLLSGFLLFSKTYSTTVFLRKRFTRVLIPGLVWIVVYLIYGYFASHDPATLGAAFLKLVQGPVHYHLWFIYLILGLYLMYPLLRPWVQQADERDFQYFFALCILGTWVYKILLTFFALKIGLRFELFTGYLGLFVLGYYLGNKVAAGEPNSRPGLEPWALTRRQLIILGWALVALATSVTALGGYWHSTATGAFEHYFYDYLTPQATLGAAGWLLIARHGWNARPLLEVEVLFAAASYGIYLAHVLILDWLSECGYGHSTVHPAVAIPLTVCMATLLSFSVVLLIRALPFGKNIA